jgi:hypothetical protein
LAIEQDKLKKFDVEHALKMHASSYIMLPAEMLYDKEVIEAIKLGISSFNVYFIGRIQKLTLKNIADIDDNLILCFDIFGRAHELRWPIPKGFSLVGDAGDGFYLIDAGGTTFTPRREAIFERLAKENGIKIDFEVLYIGQAFGQDGTRNVLDRLMKHETLQRIALQDNLPGYELTLLLLEIVMENSIRTVFSPKAEDMSNPSSTVRFPK